MKDAFVMQPQQTGASTPESYNAVIAAAPADTIKQRREEWFQHYLEFEQNFRERYFALWLGTLLGPWVLTALIIGGIYLWRGWEFTRALLTVGAISFSFAGRFVIPMENFSNLAPQLTSEHVFWLVSYQDFAVALFMAFHAGFLFKLPMIGPKLQELMIDGEIILTMNPWMRRLTFVGLVAFIAFPLAATGSVGGAIFGRLLGLSRWATFWGSLCGAIIGNAAMLYSSKVLLRYLPADSSFVQWGGLLSIGLIILILERRYAAIKRGYLDKLQTEHPFPPHR
ncbi:MAG: hypothetical protein KatS3mg114_0063 [Planctomycetaceae bacterium]|nr:MAG: hypothetical protein KatS3mg114_0063 [Planctomycetaceae bacterium]